MWTHAYWSAMYWTGLYWPNGDTAGVAGRFGASATTLAPLTMHGGTLGPVLPPPPWTIPEQGGRGDVIVIRRRRRW